MNSGSRSSSGSSGRGVTMSPRPVSNVAFRPVTVLPSMSYGNRVPDPTEMSASKPPPSLAALAQRFDPRVLELGRRRARVRLDGSGVGAWDAVLEEGRARLEQADGARPDAVITADGRTWSTLAEDLRGGMDAFRSGRLTVRHDL